MLTPTFGDSPDLSRADPETLRALAAFFDHQAAALRYAAEQQLAKIHNAERAAAEHQDARKRFLRLGARIAALKRLTGSVESAKAIMVNRGEWTREQLGFAYSGWLRLRRARDRKIRDAEIRAAKRCGLSSGKLAVRYRLTRRAIDKIAAQPSQSPP